MKKIDPNTIERNMFTAFADQWPLLTAGDLDNCNTMTIGWGGLGVLWGKKAATVYVRPQRYTYQFMEKSDYFTLSFFTEEWREALKLCGTKSGREVDKVNQCNLSLAYGQGQAPYFQEAELVLVCKKMYYADLDPSHILDPDVDTKVYPTHDYHRMYIGEVVEAYSAH